MEAPLAIVAIGGNALISDASHQGLADQARAVASACGAIAELASRGWRVVVTHGNGPQVGFILRRSEIAHGEVPPVPMDYATADTQGAIGSMFQRGLAPELARRGLSHRVVTLVTHVRIDPRDPAFLAPDKPIGPFFELERAQLLARELGWVVAEDSGRGWRRLVASPRPLEIVESSDIDDLASHQRIVIACGGGGIPVTVADDGTWTGHEAVIDKDRTSALLARSLGARSLLLCTGVDAVYLGWGTPTQRRLDHVTPLEARTAWERGEFGAGSMAPKVEAALEFLGGPGANRRAVIGSLNNLAALAEGHAGTVIEESL